MSYLPLCDLDLAFECLGLPCAHVSNTAQTLTRQRLRIARSPLPCPPLFWVLASASPPLPASARPTSPTPHPSTTALRSSCSLTPVPCPLATSAPIPPPANASPQISGDQHEPLRTVHRSIPTLSRNRPRFRSPPPPPPSPHRNQRARCRHSSLTCRRPNLTSRTSVAHPQSPITSCLRATRPYPSSMALVMRPLRCPSFPMRTGARSLGRSAAAVVDPMVARVRYGQANLPYRSLSLTVALEGSNPFVLVQ